MEDIIDNATNEPTIPQVPTEKTQKVLQLFCLIFNPLWVPLILFCILFYGTYLRMVPALYKHIILGIVNSFTLIIPAIVLFVYIKIQKIRLNDLPKLRKQFLPYILVLIGYVACIFSMYKSQMPPYMPAIMWTVTSCLIGCTLLNLKWCICVYTAGYGLVVGFLITFSSLFSFNPSWWLCIFILLSGILGTACILRGLHTLFEVFGGFLLGMFCGINGILFI